MTNIHMRDIEKEKYKDYAFKKDLKYIRPVLLLGTLLYALFTIIDFNFYPQYVPYFLKIRFILVVPLVLMGFFYSFHKSFRYIYQYVLMALTYLAGLGIILMIITIKEPNYYYGGLFLVFALNFFLLRLRTIYSSITAGLLLFSFLMLTILFSDINIGVIIENLIFYSSFCFIGVVGSRYFEQYRLNHFYQESLIMGEKIVLEKQIYKQYEDTKNYHTATIITLAKLAESRDLLTGNHINRVSKLSYLLAKKLPNSIYENNNLVKKEFLDTIMLSSSLHDIGKIAISDMILNKPGQLTKEEFEVIKTHTTKGYEMLKEIEKDYKDNMFITLGLQISKSHHERWDGRGYPEGLKGNEIPLAARIVAVVDVYDALISERPYKPAFSKEKSLEIIAQGIGKHFDPIISKIFIKLKSN
ncbi:HD-GYP domain-containing protein [Mariniplasma anaerobium]|uniref:Uncharacterized protein n=1 Tax=Mariniplasma anaerobium TaxID=2735436 RepID=A0A7U9TJW2_9MOLU|nr:HD domain-containing phosphohydrolase [Mariniplasma anaerobium]BCR36701.1 hypothetical protein MPAN_015940 [Mariniplasma anaerobium]